MPEVLTANRYMIHKTLISCRMDALEKHPSQINTQIPDPSLRHLPSSPIPNMRVRFHCFVLTNVVSKRMRGSSDISFHAPISSITETISYELCVLSLSDKTLKQ